MDDIVAKSISDRSSENISTLSCIMGIAMDVHSNPINIDDLHRLESRLRACNRELSDIRDSLRLYEVTHEDKIDGHSSNNIVFYSILVVLGMIYGIVS